MANIKPDHFGIVLLTKPMVSGTGRYVFFMGQHYDGSDLCFDVGVCYMHVKGHPVVRRHYKMKDNPKAKEEAMAYWTELRLRIAEIDTITEEADEPTGLSIIRPN